MKKDSYIRWCRKCDARYVTRKKHSHICSNCDGRGVHMKQVLRDDIE